MPEGEGTKPEGAGVTPEVEELFDDANGDLALGDLDSAVTKYRRCTDLAPDFADGPSLLFNGNHVRKIARDGTITTIVGTGETEFSEFSGDGGLATAATLQIPGGVAFDTEGNLYIADTGHDRVRKID